MVIWLQNYGKVCQEASLDASTPPVVPLANTCPCERFRTAASIEFDGHVATTDLGFFQDARLRSYWLKGRKFRIQAHPGMLESSVEARVENFIHCAAKRKRMDKQTFDTWKNKLFSAI